MQSSSPKTLKWLVGKDRAAFTCSAIFALGQFYYSLNLSSDLAVICLDLKTKPRTASLIFFILIWLFLLLFFSEGEQTKGVLKIELLPHLSGIVFAIASSGKKRGMVGNCPELSAQIECGLCSSVQHAVFTADKRHGSIVNSCCTICCETWREC